MTIDFYADDFDPQSLTLSSLEEEVEICHALGQIFPLFEEDAIAPSWLLKKPLEEEVVFYAGTFNPWHLGHRACLELCPTKNIIVVPDFNPWKEDEERQRPWEHLKDLLFRLAETDFSIYPGFLAKSSGNPTIDWLPKVKVEKKSLLMGDDSFLGFHKWKQVDELVKHITTLYVAPRGADPVALEEQVQRFPELNIVFLEHHDFEEVSSSGLRKK